MKGSTVAALVVLLLLGGYIYFFEREPVPESDGEPVFEVEQDAIVRFDIRQRGEPEVTAEKKDDGWRIVAPIEAEADPDEIDNLLRSAASMRFERSVAKASEVDLGAFGLAEPTVELSFRTEGGEELGLAFGSDTPTSGNRYARRQGDEDILVVASHSSLGFEKTAWDLRDKTIFDVSEDAEAKRIAIDRPAGRLVFARVDGDWRLEEPFLARAEAYEASGIASQIKSAEMQEIVTDGDFDRPGFTVRIELEGEEEPLLLEIGEKRDIDYLARTPSRADRFLVDGTLVDDLAKEASDYVSKKLFHYSTFQVHRFRIGERKIEKDDSGDEAVWQETSPETRELDRSVVEDLLYKLNSTSATEIAEGVAFSPKVTIAVASGDPEREETTELGEPGEDAVYARRQGDDVFLKLPLAAWQEVEALLPLTPKAEAKPEPENP
ncbi:MAG TPA: DUF4340 domain-containing protein [Vicinamibacteria bacterium]|nr:DUF4340 domain-containing protein [Vicinamibacteria bacterium]